MLRKTADTAANEQDLQDPSEDRVGRGPRIGDLRRIGSRSWPTASSTSPVTTPPSGRPSSISRARKDLMLLTVEADDLGRGPEVGGLARRDPVPAPVPRPEGRRGPGRAGARARRRRRAGARRACHEMSLHDIAARALHALDPEDAHGWAIKGLKMGLGPRQSRRRRPDPGGQPSPACRCPTAWVWPQASTRTPKSPPPCPRPASASWSAARSRPWPRPAIRVRACFG
jgi:hypothetical protein